MGDAKPALQTAAAFLQRGIMSWGQGKRRGGLGLMREDNGRGGRRGWRWSDADSMVDTVRKG